MKKEMMRFAMTDEERALVITWCKESSGNPYELHTDIFNGYTGKGSELFTQRFTHLKDFVKSNQIDVNPEDLPYKAWISCAPLLENGETLYNTYIMIDMGNGWCAANKLFLRRPFTFLIDYVKALEKEMKTYDEKINMNLVSRDDVFDFFYEHMNLKWNKNRNVDDIVDFVCDKLGSDRVTFEKMINEEVTKYKVETEYLVQMVTVDQLQNILRNKTTTFVKTICDKYFSEKNFEKWDRKQKASKWYFSQYDCRRRLRTICRFYDGEHEINITLRKKAGYYFLIELDRHRIFECDPNILVHNEKDLSYVIEKYKELFYSLVN